jgi:hypothetical protein
MGDLRAPHGSYGSIKHKGDEEDGAIPQQYLDRALRNTSYVAEAIVWSENGNNATMYNMGSPADEADTKLLSALRELKLVPETAQRVEPTA